MTGKDPKVFLAHARDCLGRIAIIAADGEHAFFHDIRNHDAILRNLEIVGQCIRDAGVAYLEQAYPGIPWRSIAAFRNVLAHAYMGVKSSMVWQIVQDDLPSLQAALNKILENWEP